MSYDEYLEYFERMRKQRGAAAGPPAPAPPAGPPPPQQVHCQRAHFDRIFILLFIQESQYVHTAEMGRGGNFK